MVQQERKDAVNTYVTTKDEIKKHDFKDYELQRNSHQIAKASQYRKKETSRDDKQVIMFKISANLEKHLKTYRQVEIWKTFLANYMDLDKTAAALGIQPTQAKKQIDKISKMLKIAVQKEFEEKNTPKKIKKDIFT